jgi:hypothetical protein
MNTWLCADDGTMTLAVELVCGTGWEQQGDPFMTLMRNMYVLVCPHLGPTITLVLIFCSEVASRSIASTVKTQSSSFYAQRTQATRNSQMHLHIF